MVIQMILDPGAFRPEKAHEADAGFDLRAKDCDVVRAGDSAAFDTGVHIAIPNGYAVTVRSKSGLYFNHGILTTGLVDSGYTGSIRVKLTNTSKDDFNVYRGDKIAQITFEKVESPDFEIVESFEETERGDGGFGSTGR